MIDKKIRERKSLESCRLEFKFASLKESVFAENCRFRSGLHFSLVLKEVVPFLFESLSFMSDLNIHVTGSQLLREALNCRFTMADISNSRFTPIQLKNIMLGINLAIPFLEGSRKDASLRLLKFSGFDLSSSQ